MTTKTTLTLARSLALSAALPSLFTSLLAAVDLSPTLSTADAVFVDAVPRSRTSAAVLSLVVPSFLTAASVLALSVAVSLSAASALASASASGETSPTRSYFSVGIGQPPVSWAASLRAVASLMPSRM